MLELFDFRESFSAVFWICNLQHANVSCALTLTSPETVSGCLLANVPTLMIVSLIFIDALLFSRLGFDLRSLTSAIIPGINDQQSKHTNILMQLWALRVECFNTL